MSRPARILVVDDEAAIRFTLEELLTSDGHQVVSAESGERALTYIADQPFDLALLDLRLGGIGGLDVLAALRQQALDTAVIVLTAHGSMETAINALRQGAHDYLLKPCDAADLRESVRTALRKRERQRRQNALLLQVEQDLTASLEEIREAVVHPHSVLRPGATRPVEQDAHLLRQGGLIVDLAQHIITLDGHQLQLSPSEYGVLAYLTEKAPHVVTPQELVREVQGYECDNYEASDIVRHYIHRIRQRVKASTEREDIIRTVRGVGYALNA